MTNKKDIGELLQLRAKDLIYLRNYGRTDNISNEDKELLDFSKNPVCPSIDKYKEKDEKDD